MRKRRLLWIFLAGLAALLDVSFAIAAPITGDWSNPLHEYTFGVDKLSDKSDRFELFNVRGDQHWGRFHFDREDDRVCFHHGGSIHCSGQHSDFGFYLKDHANPCFKWFFNPLPGKISKGYPCDTRSLFWGRDGFWGHEHEWKHRHWRSHKKKNHDCDNAEVPEPGTLGMMMLGLLMGLAFQFNARRTR